jgi:hypothetical protein
MSILEGENRRHRRKIFSKIAGWDVEKRSPIPTNL